jgi:hypothetical protein
MYEVPGPKSMIRKKLPEWPVLIQQNYEITKLLRIQISLRSESERSLPLKADTNLSQLPIEF